MLSTQHPYYKISVKTPFPDVFSNNPHVEPLTFAEYEKVPMHCHTSERATINRSNQQPTHFLDCWTQHLADSLGVYLDLKTNRPHLYLTDWEKKVRPGMLPDGRFALVNSGYKSDYQAKTCGTQKYQDIVDSLRGVVTFVQVGHLSDNHTKLKGVIDLVGKTSVRDLIRMVWWSDFCLTPISALHHIAASFYKPCFTFNSREPDWFIRYNTSTIYSSNGLLPCNQYNACWRDSCLPEASSRCALPVLRGNEWVPTCLDRIPAERVVNDIKTLYDSGAIYRSEIMSDDTYKTPENPKAGVVIGTYGSPAYVTLQLESLKRFHPDTPVLVVDDCSPKQRELIIVCEEYGADYINNPQRLGHIRGDLAVYVHGLQWAKRNGFDLLVKISRRFLFTKPWLDELKETAVRSQFPTVSNWCEHYNFFRSEFVGMNVSAWYPFVNELLEGISNNCQFAEGYIYERVVTRIRLNEVAKAIEVKRPCLYPFSLVGDNRHLPEKGTLWHDVHRPHEYALVAKEWGLNLTDFEL